MLLVPDSSNTTTPPRRLPSQTAWYEKLHPLQPADFAPSSLKIRVSEYDAVVQVPSTAWSNVARACCRHFVIFHLDACKSNGFGVCFATFCWGGGLGGAVLGEFQYRMLLTVACRRALGVCWLSAKLPKSAGLGEEGFDAAVLVVVRVWTRGRRVSKRSIHGL